jgi:small subunit ribosomal protein S4
MARYTGPRVRISRRFGLPIFGPSKYLERRNYGPGVHGPKSRRKHTDYGLGLIEKQKFRYYYGLMEKQFRGVYEKALRRRGVTGEQMLQILETRLDNVVFHLGFANTRAAARQMVCHGHITVKGRKVGIPSYRAEGERRDRSQEPQCVAPVGDQEFGSRRQPRRAGLVVA